MANNSEETVPVDRAMEMTANWRTYLSTSGQTFNVRSYYIPIVSIQSLLTNNPDAEAVRAYIGLADATDPTTSQLLLVPIVDGKEVIYLPTAAKGDPDEGDNDDSNIYDLSTPCPPQCGPPTDTLEG